MLLEFLYALGAFFLAAGCWVLLRRMVQNFKNTLEYHRSRPFGGLMAALGLIAAGFTFVSVIIVSSIYGSVTLVDTFLSVTQL